MHLRGFLFQRKRERKRNLLTLDSLTMFRHGTHREKRVEQHRQNEARVTSEIRNLEKKLLELIAARSVRSSSQNATRLASDSHHRVKERERS